MCHPLSFLNPLASPLYPDLVAIVHLPYRHLDYPPYPSENEIIQLEHPSPTFLIFTQIIIRQAYMSPFSPLVASPFSNPFTTQIA